MRSMHCQALNQSSGAIHLKHPLTHPMATPKKSQRLKRIQARSSIWIEQRFMRRCETGFTVLIVEGNACSTAWEDGCEIPDLAGAIRAAPLIDAAGDIYIGTKDNEDSKLYKIDGSCPTSPVIWETDTNADVYTTGVILTPESL